MSLSKVFALALILSCGWHIFWGLLFDLSLDEKQIELSNSAIPVYYIGKSSMSKDKITTQGLGTATSIFPQLTLPQIDIIRPPAPSRQLPQIEEEMLAQRAKEIGEYKTDISLKKNLTPTIDRQSLPDWVIPEEYSKKKDSFIRWEDDSRELTQRYYPPLPQWAKEAGIISKVTLKFTVSENGDVKEVHTEISSGEARLDLLAANYLRRWQFSPSNKESIGFATIDFKEQ